MIVAAPRTLVFAYPGDIETLTGGYVYDKRVVQGLKAAGWHVLTIGLGEGFPFPDAETVGRASAALAGIEAGTPVLVDGLALSAAEPIAAAAASRGPLVALVHHPLALETGLDPAAAARLRASERAALAFADHVVVTSGPTADTLAADFGVPAVGITIAPPGIDPAGFAPGRSRGPARLLAVGQLVPRKGHDVLLRALARLKRLSWRLAIAGIDPTGGGHEADLRALAGALGLADRVEFRGALDREALAAAYLDADVFVLASLYEGYGMVYAEALSHGLPVIGTTGGAIPSVVPADAGLLAEPGDPASLAAALRTMIADRPARRGFALGARRAAAALPRWEDTVRIVADGVAAGVARARRRRRDPDGLLG